MGKKSILRVGAELGAWTLGRRRRVVVGGNSMLPTLEPGWFVLFHPGSTAVEGDVVVARHPDRSDLLIVKRFVDGSLVSDNQAEGRDFATDSTILGPVTLVLDRPRLAISRR